MKHILLTHDPLDLAALCATLKRYDAGALATFAGTVRAEDACDRQLLALEYEAFVDMALSQLTAIRARAMEKFAVLDASIAHRLGRINLGEASIVVAVVAAHRAEAFDACRWIVDQVKLDVPIWKKDIWSDGTTSWVDPTCSSE